MNSKFGHSLSLVCWAYNEELLIEDFLRRANALLSESVSDYEIVLVDDASTDRTPEIIQKMSREIPQLRVIRNETNLNVGLSSRKAILSAQKEFLFWQTVDWSYDLSNFRQYLELLKTYQVVAGVRRTPTHFKSRPLKAFAMIYQLFGTDHLIQRSDTLGKAIVSIINYLLIRTLFRVPLSDYQNVVFYPTPLIQSLNPEAKSSFSNPEYLIKAHWLGASIAEVPISFIPRSAGEAKGTRLKAIWASVTDIFTLWFRWIALKQVKRGKTRGNIRRLRKHEWASPASSLPYKA